MKNQSQRQRSSYGVIKVIAPNTFFNPTRCWHAHVDKRDSSYHASGHSKTQARKNLLKVIENVEAGAMYISSKNIYA